eukprot:scaffold10720_cov69-Phaeocystis_antarctica.AAC.16
MSWCSAVSNAPTGSSYDSTDSIAARNVTKRVPPSARTCEISPSSDALAAKERTTVSPYSKVSSSWSIMVNCSSIGKVVAMKRGSALPPLSNASSKSTSLVTAWRQAYGGSFRLSSSHPGPGDTPQGPLFNGLPNGKMLRRPRNASTAAVSANLFSSTMACTRSSPELTSVISVLRRSLSAAMAANVLTWPVATSR